MKYVMMAFTFREIQHLYPVIFPDDLIHLGMAECARHYKHGTESYWVRAKPVSAGDIYYNTAEGWVCTGFSDSLKMKAHPEDSRVINTFNYLHGLGFDKRSAK